jgi:hypothetical protein
MTLPVQNVRGQVFFSYHEAKNLEFALDYQPRDCDRILLAGPASGVHHCLDVLKNIINSADKNVHGQYVYFLDSRGSRVVDSQRRERDSENPTLMATHMPLNLIAYNSRPKYLIIIRNPKDICVSFYRSWKSQTDLNIEFNEFFEMFITGRELPYGDYFEATRVHWEHRDCGNCTLITYESLIDSQKDSVVKMAELLGKEYVDRLYVRDGTGSDDSTTLLDLIIQTTDVKRDGMPGDWRAVLTQSQSDLIDEKVRDEWMGTGLESLWEREMQW